MMGLSKMHNTPHSQKTKDMLRLKNLGKNMSRESREKMSLSFKGRVFSESHKIKIGLANKGKKRTIEQRENIRKSLVGRKLSPEHIEHVREKIIGRKYPNRVKGYSRPQSVKEKISRAKMGNKNPMWKGGITPENEKIRQSAKYAKWRLKVFTRDNFTCVQCGDNTGGNLQADHIKPFSRYPELRFRVSNGRTLCIPCHKKTNTYGWSLYHADYYRGFE